MLELEKKLFGQLRRLKEEYDLQGIKAEFEAEGSSFRDLVRLRRITDKLNVPLFLKIGGVEAIRDVKDSFEIGVDGLIGPMVESRFGLKKFVDGVTSIYKDKKIHRSINIETKSAVKNIDEILGLARSTIDNITIGRTDLSSSYFDQEIQPDSEFILGLIEELGTKIADAGLTMTVGGSLSKRSVELFRKQEKKWRGTNLRLETRKVILSMEMMLDKKDSITEALKFEELYILSKKEINDLFLEAETARLTRLKMRS